MPGQELTYGIPLKKNNAEMCYSSSGIYCPEASQFFSIVGDIPEYAKEAWNKRVLAFKANNTWNSISAVLPFLPTQSMYEVLRDAKTMNLQASFHALVAENSPFTTGACTGGSEGINFFAGTVIPGTGFIKTGIIPSETMQPNNSAIAIGSSRDESGLVGISFGALQTTSQSITFQKRSNTNTCYGDMYGTGTGGRVTQTSATGDKGVYILNRRNQSDFKLYKNGVQIGSTNAVQGVLPTIEMYLNCYNQNGSQTSIRNRAIAFFCVYNTSLTPYQVMQENIAWDNFMVEMERKVTFKRNIVIDGNSHTVIWRSEFFRHLQYVNGGLGLNAKYSNVGRGGKTTTQMNTNGVADVDSLYDASCEKNICVAWEATNDIGAGVAIATVISNYETYCQDRRNAGYKVIAMSVLARDYGDTTKTLNSDLFNVYLRDNWSSFADAYIPPISSNYWAWRADYASDGAYTTAITNICNSTIYYSDSQIHLTQLGEREWGEAVAKAIREL